MRIVLAFNTKPWSFNRTDRSFRKMRTLVITLACLTTGWEIAPGFAWAFAWSVRTTLKTFIQEASIKPLRIAVEVVCAFNALASVAIKSCVTIKVKSALCFASTRNTGSLSFEVLTVHIARALLTLLGILITFWCRGVCTLVILEAFELYAVTRVEVAVRSWRKALALGVSWTSITAPKAALSIVFVFAVFICLAFNTVPIRTCRVYELLAMIVFLAGLTNEVLTTRVHLVLAIIIGKTVIAVWLDIKPTRIKRIHSVVRGFPLKPGFWLNGTIYRGLFNSPHVCMGWMENIVRAFGIRQHILCTIKKIISFR